MLIRDKFKTTINPQERFDAVKNLLISPENIYQLTLAPVHNQDVRFVIKSINKFLHYLNQHQFGKRYKNKNQYIHGIAILESAEIHNPHVHIIIRGPLGDLEHEYPLELSIKIKLPKVKCLTPVTPLSRSTTTESFIGRESWHLQDYYRESLEEYLSKSFNTEGYWHNDPLDNVSTLTSDGVLFGIREDWQPDINLYQNTAN